MYFLAKQITGKNIVGILAAFLLALSPWHIVLSRATSESVIALFFTLTGFWLLFSAIEKKDKRWIVYSAASLLAGYFFYHSLRLVIPILVIVLAFQYRKSFASSWLRLLAIAFVALTIGLLFTKAGTGRLGQVAFYKNKSLESVFMAQTGANTPLSRIGARLAYGKPAVYFREYAKQYLSYFSPDYLFLNGGYPDRYRIPDQGLLPIVLAPFLLLGLMVFLRSNHTPTKLFLLALLVVAPLPASLTYEDAPNMHRSLALVVPLLVLAAFGCVACIENLKKSQVLRAGMVALFLLTLLLETGRFFYVYDAKAPSYKSVLRNEGTEELFRRIKTSYASYDHIVMPMLDELPMYASFYLNQFGSFPKGLYTTSQPEVTIGKMIFVDKPCASDVYKGKLTGRVLFVDYEGCPGTGFSEQKAIVRSDDTVAYRIYDTKQ